ncbi:MAG: GNAT family N-acetyltransferase [Candidatus Moraniibacteriota bacterium]
MEKGKFNSAWDQFKDSTDDKQDREFEEVQYLYAKIGDLEQELNEQAEKSYEKGRVRVNPEKLSNFKNSLQELENEIEEGGLQNQKDMMQRLGEIEQQLYSMPDVLNWPVEFGGQERISEERKAQDFLQESFFELSKEILADEETFLQKNAGQLASILSRLVLPVKRSDYAKDEEGDFSRMCREWEDNLEIEKIIETCLDLVKEDKNHLLDQVSLEVIFEQDMDFVVSRTLEMIRNETMERGGVERLSDFLCHLEFGKVEIKREGVKYFDKIYDLGEFNNLNYFAHRLTVNGDIGIFDENRKLIKYFNIGDLETEQKRLKPEISDFNYQTLYFEKKNQSQEEREKRMLFLKEFQENYFDFYEADFFQKTGIRFNNLSFKEQGWFLFDYLHANKERKQEFFDFAQAYGEDGLKSFISLEVEGSNGKGILEIAGKLDKSAGNLVFSKLADLSRLAQQKGERFEEFIDLEDIQSKSKDLQIRLLKRANNIINEFANKLNEKSSNQEKEVIVLLNKLKRSRSHLELLGAFLKEVKEQGQTVNAEQINGYTRKTAKTEDLAQNPDLEKEIEERYRFNQSRKSEQELERLMEQFREQKNHDAKYYLDFFDSKKPDNPEKDPANLLGYIRSSSFDGEKELPEGERYLGALNVNPVLQQSSIGKKLMENVIEQEFSAGAKKLHAHVPQNSPSYNLCVNHLGFEEESHEGEYETKTGEKIPRVRIVIQKPEEYHAQ